MVEPLKLIETTISMTDFVQDPIGVIASCGHNVLNVTDKDKPVVYCLSPQLYEQVLDVLDDIELGLIADERERRGEIVRMDIENL